MVMGNPNNILLAVDESEASRRAIAYITNMVAGKTGVQVGLFHLVSPPQRMLEWGGSEDVEVEEKVAAERKQMFLEMEKEVQQKGDTLLRSLQEPFAEKGIAVTVLPVEIEGIMNRKHIAQDLLKTAEEGGYGTVVVGRHSFSGWQRLFKHHVGEELVRKGEGITVWVVE
jgi:nucleotide-binding universal stress UspA family protein